MSQLEYVKNACVFGSGAFGTALGTVLAKKSKHVRVWHLDGEEAAAINKKKENFLFLKGAKLPFNMEFTADVQRAYEGAEIILFVIPTQFMRGFLKEHGKKIAAHCVANNVPVVVCSKGIEKGTLKFPVDIVSEYMAGCQLAVVAGPSFAIEVAKSLMTQVAVAAADLQLARRVQRLMTTQDALFRCWATTDMVGCEVASAVKNVLAIASGMCSGLGLGLNARAALITRGLLEIRDLTMALGGTGEAVFGLAGMGDLMLTCSSEMSRNFSVGQKLGRGQEMAAIMKEQKAVAEGAATAEPLFHLARKLRVNMPLCKEVYRVVFEGKSAMASLLRISNIPLLDEGLAALTNDKTKKNPQQQQQNKKENEKKNEKKNGASASASAALSGQTIRPQAKL